jgi:glycosyltransferase involved in cell wall biosynthesis
MRVLHVLPSGGMGWAGGIRPTLKSLADSPLGQQHSFEVTGQDELSSMRASWAPDLLIWHVASSWRALPRMVRSGRRRQVLFEHHYCQGFEEHTVPSRRRFRAMLRLAYGCMERVVAVSRAQASWMTAARLVAPSRLRLICSSRPLDGFLSLPAPEATAPGAPLRLLAYGRLTRQKGFDRLIRAMALLRDAPLQLQLVGDGEQRQELEQLAAGDGRIELLGARKDIPALLAAADAVIIPSRWEPWGNVCLEARAAARPVIVSPVDGLTEQVEGCGPRATAATEDGLAEALQQLLGSTPAERAAWSRAARTSARDSWQVYLDGWQALLAEPR